MKQLSIEELREKTEE